MLRDLEEVPPAANFYIFVTLVFLDFVEECLKNRGHPKPTDHPKILQAVLAALVEVLAGCKAKT